jgi:hypothetical protein
MLAKVFLEYGIERSEVARIFKPYAATYDMLGSISRFVEDRQKVANGLLGLSDDVP